MRTPRVKVMQVLVAANVLVASLALVWMIRMLWVEEQLSTEQARDPLESVNFSPSPIETGAIKAHPLFTQSRLPVPEQPRPDDQGGVLVQPPPRLVGLFKSTRGEMGALMEDAQTGVRRFVRSGGELGGWTLFAIRSKVAVLRQGEQELVVPLSPDAGTAELPPSSDQGTKAP